MNDIKKNYSELLALTQLYLLREHKIKEKIPGNVHTHSYFKNYYLTKRKPIPKETSLPKQPIHTPLTNTTQNNPTKSLAPIAISQVNKPQIERKIEPTIQRNENSILVQNTTKLVLEVQSPTPISAQTNDFKSFFKEHFPTLTLNEQVPSDEKAKKIKNAWKKENQIPPIVILSFNDQPIHLAFLKNIARAISLHIAPASVLSAPKIELEKKWENLLTSTNLRLIIASDYGLYLLPEGMKYYQSNPLTTKHQLLKTPLLLLSDLSLYLKEPQLKPLLWRTICLELGI